jgi:hypothetical protein
VSSHHCHNSQRCHASWTKKLTSQSCCHYSIQLCRTFVESDLTHHSILQCEDYVVVSPDVLHGDLVTRERDKKDYAERMCKLAKELVQVGNSHISGNTGQNTGNLFGFKAGLHAGPLSSGILGRTRRFYKIFGDTVVMAARLSQNARPSTVQISLKVGSE